MIKVLLLVLIPFQVGQIFFTVHDYGFCFRVLGYGMGVYNRAKRQAPFSVRNGHKKEYRLGVLGFKFFKPELTL